MGKGNQGGVERSSAGVEGKRIGKGQGKLTPVRSAPVMSALERSALKKREPCAGH